MLKASLSCWAVEPLFLKLKQLLGGLANSVRKTAIVVKGAVIITNLNCSNSSICSTPSSASSIVLPAITAS